MISTGNADLDAALGVGGLPIGSITELHGLSTAGLSAFVTRLLRSAQPSRSRVIAISKDHGRDLIRARVESAFQEGAVVLALVPEGGISAAWLMEHGTAQWLRVRAEQYSAAILCAIPMMIRVNSSLEAMQSGLARHATLRLEIQAESRTESYHIRVVKNTVAEPFGEATLH